MLGQKNWLVIMVTKNDLQLVGPGEAKIETVLFPPNIISNMEVIDKDGLYTLITNWLKLRPHISGEIIWLLAPDVYFEHVLTSVEQDRIDSETLQFLDTVPFEEVLSRTYKSTEWRQIIAVNKDLIMSLIQAFSLQGYITKTVVPSHLLQADGVLTPELEHNAIRRATELSRESLVSAPSSLYVPVVPQNFAVTEPKAKSALTLLLSVFGVLLAILGFVIYLNY